MTPDHLQTSCPWCGGIVIIDTAKYLVAHIEPACRQFLLDTGDALDTLVKMRRAKGMPDRGES